MKGAVGQVENHVAINNPNPNIGFRCTHYSVTESSGTVDLVITKKHAEDFIKFGVRTKTVPNGAIEGKDFVAFN
jgi:hypothetical protein